MWRLLPRYSSRRNICSRNRHFSLFGNTRKHTFLYFSAENAEFPGLNLRKVLKEEKREKRVLRKDVLEPAWEPLLTVLARSDRSWPFWSFWLFLAVLGCSWLFWRFLTVLAVLDCSWSFLTVLDRSWPFLIVLDRPGSSWIVLDRSWSSLSVLVRPCSSSTPRLDVSGLDVLARRVRPRIPRVRPRIPCPSSNPYTHVHPSCTPVLYHQPARVPSACTCTTARHGKSALLDVRAVGLGGIWNGFC